VKKIFVDIKRQPEFKRDAKRLCKKFRSYLDTFIERQLKLYHKLGIDNMGVVPMPNLGISYPAIYKAKKFACKALKGKGSASGIRAVYAYFKEEDRIEFIEVYYKGEKENEDRARILKYYK